MVNPEIVNYLIEGKMRGFDLNLLRQKLVEGGFSENEVDDAISYIQIMKVDKEIQVKSVEGDKYVPSIMSKEIGRNGFFWKVGKSMFSPSELFTKTKEDGLFSVLKYLWLISILPFVIVASILFALPDKVSALLLDVFNSLNFQVESIN